MRKSKVNFDVSNIEHLRIYYDFLTERNWRNGCPFRLEEPFTNIPTMIERMIIDKHLPTIIESLS